ncbi:hypothetical protein PQQ59_33715 [Paraburkholderia aspalathi]|uniref:hypothetical protein n=1 Tax=Paraburkholderia aspalathi TaxID=1324617 RepID=UPI0038B77342
MTAKADFLHSSRKLATAPNIRVTKCSTGSDIEANMQINPVLDTEQLNDALTGAPLASVAPSDLYRCARCTSTYRSASVQTLRNLNGGACLACSAIGTILAIGDTDGGHEHVPRTAAVQMSRSGIKLVAEAVRAGESDLLAGNERAPFLLKDLSGAVLVKVAPQVVWTHAALFALVDSVEISEHVAQCGGADAYVGNVWIGGTEV